MDGAVRLMDAGAHINVRDFKDGDTPLHIAAANGTDELPDRFEMVNTLLSFRRVL